MLISPEQATERAKAAYQKHYIEMMRAREQKVTEMFARPKLRSTMERVLSTSIEKYIDSFISRLVASGGLPDDGRLTVKIKVSDQAAWIYQNCTPAKFKATYSVEDAAEAIYFLYEDAGYVISPDGEAVMVVQLDEDEIEPLEEGESIELGEPS